MPASTFITEKTNGTNILCLVLKISKIPKISGGEKFNAFFVQNTHVKRTKWFYFWNNCMRKRQKLKTTVFVWQMILACCSQENKENCLLFFGSDFNRTGIFSSFAFKKIDFLPKLNRQFVNKKTQHFHGNAKTSEFSSLLKMLN